MIFHPISLTTRHLLQSLEHISFNKNELAGTIPPALGKLTGLRSLDLGFNYLTGPLPLQLAALKTLKMFSVSDNEVTGPFFEPFGAAWPELEELILEGAYLTGTIPTTVIEQWTNLVTLDIERTLFHGTFPTEINALMQLTSLGVSSRALGGPFPDLSKLRKLGRYPAPAICFCTTFSFTDTHLQTRILFPLVSQQNICTWKGI